MDTVDSDFSQQSIGNSMSRDDYKSRNDDIFKNDNTSREAMNCGRCFNCITSAGRCLRDDMPRDNNNMSRDDDNMSRDDDNMSRDDDNMSRDDDNMSRDDDNMSRDELVPVPPPSPARSFTRPQGHSCSVCTFSSTTIFGLEVHKGKMKSKERHLKLSSDEQICFIWHHLYLGWPKCFKFRPKTIFQNLRFKHCQDFRVQFDLYLHRKGYEIRQGCLYVQPHRYSAFDLSKTQYSWSDEHSPISKEMERAETLSEEEKWFIYYHKVDCEMNWATIYTTFIARFPRRTGRHLKAISMSFYRAFPGHRPSFFTICGNSYSWLNSDRRSPSCASVVEGR